MVQGAGGKAASGTLFREVAAAQPPGAAAERGDGATEAVKLFLAPQGNYVQEVPSSSSLLLSSLELSDTQRL